VDFDQFSAVFEGSANIKKTPENTGFSRVL